MRRSAHKDVLDFFTPGYPLFQQRPIVQACLPDGEPDSSLCAQRALPFGEFERGHGGLPWRKMPSLLQQAKRWLGNKWNDWLCVVRTSSDRLINFDGEVARFDSLRTTRSICFIPGALPLANAVYWQVKWLRACLIFGFPSS